MHGAWVHSLSAACGRSRDNVKLDVQNQYDACRARAGVCKGGNAVAGAGAPPSRSPPGLRTAAAARRFRRATARASTARAAGRARGHCAKNEPQRCAGACESRSAQILHPKP
jgi:hypothetical protein